MSPKKQGLKLNTSARISVRKHDGKAPSFLVVAPVKGASLSSVRVSEANLPFAYAFLCSVLIDGRENVQIGEHDATELRRIGLFAPEDALPLPVAYQFPTRAPARSVSVVPGFSIDEINGQAALRLPADWPESALRFEPHRYGGIWAPVLVAAGNELDSRSNTALKDIIKPDTVLDEEATRAHFEREGFAILENLLPVEHVHEMGRYFQALAAQGFLSRNDECGTHRHIAHNHPVARFWHDQLNERVSRLVGRRTKPSYSYVSLYIAGCELALHTDRPPCEYTITLLLDYAPLDADDRSPWALTLRGRDGVMHSLYQRVGDALIFKGRELQHCRDVLPEGHRSASLLFHFVDEDYDGEMT